MLRVHTSVLRSTLALALVLAVGPVAGCDDADPATTEDPTAELELDLCERLAEGPAAALTAGDSTATAADAGAMHTRFDVTLHDDGAGGHRGYVSFPADEDTTYALVVGGDATFVVRDAFGAEVAPSLAETGSDHCALIGTWAQIPVGVGTYVVEIHSATLALVPFVYAEPGHEDHDHE